MPRTFVTDDHWADAGGRSLEALEEFLTERSGELVVVKELQIVASVEDLRDHVFGPKRIITKL